MKKTYPVIPRLISAMLIAAFFARDVVWANSSNGYENLAVTGLKNPRIVLNMKTVMLNKLHNGRGQGSETGNVNEFVVISPSARFYDTPESRKNNRKQKPVKSASRSLYDELRGKTVLVINGTSEVGLEIVKRLFQENVSNFESFIRLKGYAPSAADKKQCKLFLRDGRPIRICVYDMRGRPEVIDELLNNEFVRNTGPEILDVEISTSPDAYNLGVYAESDSHRIFPRLVINVSSLGQPGKTQDGAREREAFLGISDLSHILKLMDDLKCKDIWQVFPYEPEKGSVCEYAKQIEERMLDNEKNLKSAYSLEYIMRAIGIGSKGSRENMTVKTEPRDSDDWSQTDHANYFVSGLATASIDEAGKKRLCAGFLSYKLREDFGINRLRDIEKIPVNGYSKKFSLDSYISIIGYLFKEDPRSNVYLKKIAQIWVEANREITFRDSTEDNPYHQIGHASVRYQANRGKISLLYRTEKSVYKHCFELERGPKNWDLPAEELILKDKYAAKVADAVKKVRAFLNTNLKDAENPRDKEHFEARLKTLDELTILGIDSGKPFLFCDLDNNVVRAVHIGRSRKVIYIPLEFIDEDSTAAWIVYCVNWLTIYHKYKEKGYSPEKIRKALKTYANSFLKHGKPGLGVGPGDIHKRFLSLIGDYAAAERRSFGELYKEYHRVIRIKKALLSVYPGGFRPNKCSTQKFAKRWNKLADRFFMLADGFRSVADRLTSRRLYPEWLKANEYVLASDMGELPADISMKELLCLLEMGRLGDVISKFRQHFLGDGIKLQVEVDGQPTRRHVDILGLDKSDQNYPIDKDKIESLRALWEYNTTITMAKSGFLDYFKEKLKSTCEANYYIYPAKRDKVKLFEKNINKLIKYFEENYEKWAKRIDNDENIIREGVLTLEIEVKKPARKMPAKDNGTANGPGNMAHVYAAILDGDIDNTKALASSLANLYKDDAEKIVYTIRLDSSRVPANYIELIKSHYAKILSSRSGNVEVKVLGNEKLKSLVGVSVEIGGKLNGTGAVDVAGGNGGMDTLNRLIGMVNLAISVATIPEEFTDSGIDKYKSFLDIIGAQYELLTGEKLALPDNPKDITAFIRDMVMNLPPIKSYGVKPQEEFKLMEEKLESAA